MTITRLGRIVATVVAISIGLLVLLDFFFGTRLGASPVQWASVVVAFALLLGVVNLLQVHLNKILVREKDWLYSLVLVVSFGLALLAGGGGLDTAAGRGLFEYVLRPLESTLFALLAFFIASAAFRAFRIRNFETFLLVFFAIIVLLGQVPAGFLLWPEFPLIKEWVLRVPALAGTRGILLGVALGTIATGVRVLIGVDRPYADQEQPPDQLTR